MAAICQTLAKGLRLRGASGRELRRVQGGKEGSEKGKGKVLFVPPLPLPNYRYFPLHLNNVLPCLICPLSDLSHMMVTQMI